MYVEDVQAIGQEEYEQSVKRRSSVEVVEEFDKRRRMEGEAEEGEADDDDNVSLFDGCVLDSGEENTEDEDEDEEDEHGEEDTLNGTEHAQNDENSGPPSEPTPIPTQHMLLQVPAADWEQVSKRDRAAYTGSSLSTRFRQHKVLREMAK